MTVVAPAAFALILSLLRPAGVDGWRQVLWILGVYVLGVWMGAAVGADAFLAPLGLD